MPTERQLNIILESEVEFNSPSTYLPMEQSNNTLPAEIVSRIILEAKQFAFYNYVTAFLHPNAVFENMDTWPPDARVCFYSILHYMSRPDICWPYKEPTLATEARDILTEVFQKHESGLLPDRFVYDKIKKFLYGE